MTLINKKNVSNHNLFAKQTGERNNLETRVQALGGWAWNEFYKRASRAFCKKATKPSPHGHGGFLLFFSQTQTGNK